MRDVNASIITIGDELLIGQTIDTNSAFIGQELNKMGIWVRKRVAVGDEKDEIRKALDQEGRDSEIIIITGGLGPTADDVTKPLLCEYFGGKLVMNQEVLDHVTHLFEKVFRRTGPLLESNRKQAEVPDVCTVLPNKRGSAPGMLFTKDIDNVPAPGKRIFISLPGVPHEMKGLMTDQVIPYLEKEYSNIPAIIHRTAFTAGAGETILAELLKDFEPRLPSHIRLAYLPNYGMVRLRLTGRGPDRETVEEETQSLFEKMIGLVSTYVVSEEDEELHVVIGRILKERNQTVGTTESCTGGYLSHLITSVPGASAYFTGTVVCYDNEVKKKVLGVDDDILQKHGAVSEQAVIAMVKGGLKVLNTDYIIATSGILGPSGGTPEKPVGTVWLAAGNKDSIETLQLHLRFDRQRNLAMAAGNALNFLRRFILST